MCRVGNPAAPRMASLPLLPFGPDGVRRFPPRRTHPDTDMNIPRAKPDVNWFVPPCPIKVHGRERIYTEKKKKHLRLSVFLRVRFSLRFQQPPQHRL